MSEIKVVARFPEIQPEHLDEFRALAAEAVEGTRGEPGTLQYDWYYSADGRQCVLLERYASSEAVLAHAANVSRKLRRMIELGGRLELDVFGDPSPELQAATAALGPRVFTFAHGL